MPIDRILYDFISLLPAMWSQGQKRAVVENSEIDRVLDLYLMLGSKVASTAHGTAGLGRKEPIIRSCNDAATPGIVWDDFCVFVILIY